MNYTPKKGILESIPEFFQVVVALAIAIILIAVTFRFFALQTQGNKIEITGNVDQVSSRLVNYITDCWKNHRQGLDSQSAICNIIKINTDKLITEKNVTKFLDCETIPNSECMPDDCSKCVSSRYPADRQNSLIWNFDNSTSYMEISYAGAERAIEISNTFQPQ